jgi:hypothetical protein
MLRWNVAVTTEQYQEKYVGLILVKKFYLILVIYLVIDLQITSKFWIMARL